MERMFEPLDAKNSATIKYKVRERIDRQTFRALAAFSNLRNKSWQSVTIRFYEDQNEALLVRNILQLVVNPNIAGFIAMDVQKNHTVLMLENFYENFDNFLQWSSPIWEYNNDRSEVVSTGFAVQNVFRGIINGIRALHNRGLFHGNLRNGVTVSNLYEVKLVNIEHYHQGDLNLQQGILDDLDHLGNLVQYVFSRHPPAHSLPRPKSVDLFFELKTVFNNLSLDGQLWTYAYFMYHNPLFFDGNTRYMMLQKAFAFRRLDPSIFDKKVELNRGRTSMQNWVYRVTTNSYLFYALYVPDTAATGSFNPRYHQPIGVLWFHKNCYSHRKTDIAAVEKQLNDVFPDFIPKLYFEIVEKIASQQTEFGGFKIIEFFQNQIPCFP